MPMQLNDEQRKRVSDSHGLIGGFMRLHKLEDQFYGACAEGLCKAALSFDPSKSAWSTWAYLNMHSEVRHEMRNKYKQPPSCSLEAWSGTGASLDVTMPESEEIIRSLIAQLCPLEQDVLHLILAGKKQAEIAKITGISQPHVSRLKKKIGQKCKELMK